MSRVLIFGGAGFIGSHLARAYAADGSRVDIAVRPETDLCRVAGILDSIGVHRLSLADEWQVDRCIAECEPDVVFHLATRTRWPGGIPDARESVNSELCSLFNVLDGVSHLRRKPVVVRAGSLAEYGDGQVPFLEGQRERPMNVYAASLAAGTHYCEMLQRRLDFKIITARLALTYGARQNPDFLVPSLIQNCVAHKPTHVARPNDSRDLVHVDDVVGALRVLAELPERAPLVVNIATGTAPTMREISEVIAGATNCPRSLISYGNGKEGGLAPKAILGSPLLMDRIYGWRARVLFSDGLRQLVQQEMQLQLAHGHNA